MISDGLIKLKLEKLIDLMLTAGVQPSELVDNIFLEDYKRISFSKSDKSIIGELVFEEIIEDKTVTVVMRYSYDCNKIINKIEEEIDGEIKVLWDRSIAERELINDIIDTMNLKYSHDEIEKFIMTLPEDLKYKINSINVNQVA